LSQLSSVRSVSPGRIVRFVGDDNRVAPAIVTHVYNDGSVALMVFWPGELSEPVVLVPHSPEKKAYSWHWP
jgi:hypothetical protein